MAITFGCVATLRDKQSRFLDNETVVVDASKLFGGLDVNSDGRLSRREVRYTLIR
jgi:hypothetical protein